MYTLIFEIFVRALVCVLLLEKTGGTLPGKNRFQRAA